MICIIKNMRALIHQQTSSNSSKAFTHENSDQCAFNELQNDEPDICPFHTNDYFGI